MNEGVASRRPPERREYYRTTPTVTSNQSAEVTDFMGAGWPTVFPGNRASCMKVGRYAHPCALAALLRPCRARRFGHPWPLAAFPSSMKVKKKAWLRCHARTTTRRMEEPFSMSVQSRSGPFQCQDERARRVGLPFWPLAAFGSSLNVTIGTNIGRSDLDTRTLQTNQMIEYNDYLIFRPIVKNSYIRNLRINT